MLRNLSYFAQFLQTRFVWYSSKWNPHFKWQNRSLGIHFGSIFVMHNLYTKSEMRQWIFYFYVHIFGAIQTVESWLFTSCPRYTNHNVGASCVWTSSGNQPTNESNLFCPKYFSGAPSLILAAIAFRLTDPILHYPHTFLWSHHLGTS